MVNRSRQYTDGVVTATDFTLDQISEHSENTTSSFGTTWLSLAQKTFKS